MDATSAKVLIHAAAIAEGLDPKLLEAICTVESSLNALAVRYEPGFKWTVSPREWASQMRLSVETETMLQSTSYGFGQIMGAVMREYGFRGPLQACIADPAVPLMYSAKHLKRFLARYGTEEEAIAAYNAGSPRRTPGGNFENQGYVDKVYTILRKLRALA